jgi:CBS domain-containing protein
MSTDLVTIAPDDNLALALSRMSGALVRRLPVIETVDGDPVVIGIVTDRDLRLAAHVPHLGEDWEQVVDQLRGLTVADAMSGQPLTIDPDSTLAAAAQQMIDAHIGGLPVAEREHGHPYLVGIVTRTDLLAYLVRSATALG